MSTHALYTNKTVLRKGEELDAAMRPSLVVLYGAELGRRLELHDAPVVIGRGPNCDLVADVEDVSREHCCITPVGDGYELTDLGSTNGTFVNRKQLQAHTARRLAGGEKIRLGSLILKFLDGSDIEGLYHEEIYRLTILDGLTGLHNRRYFEEFMAREIARWERYQRPLAIVMFDIDDFKAVNDEYGHPAGDAVLQQLAQVVGGVMRQEVCFARLAGDEFAIGLPEVEISGALAVAERVRAAIEETVFDVAGRELNGLTVSLGTAQMTEERGDLEGLIAAVDRKLYAAKEGGRNRSE
jgi:diguanylate cyclase (GGDEF)-like protein